MSERLCPHIAMIPATLRRVAFLLAVITIAHQLAMATPLHESVMQMATPGVATHGPTQGSCDEPCPIQPIAICPAVQAALPLVALLLFLLLAGALAASALRCGVTTRRPIVVADWRPPPKHILVLFQTFRC